jgi:hypothetical protein
LIRSALHLTIYRYEACPALPTETYNTPNNTPLARKQKFVASDLQHKLQRNPAVNLLDGGASKEPPKTLRYAGSMMAPRVPKTVDQEPQERTPEEGTEEDSEEEEKSNK